MQTKILNLMRIWQGGKVYICLCGVFWGGGDIAHALIFMLGCSHHVSMQTLNHLYVTS